MVLVTACVIALMMVNCYTVVSCSTRYRCVQIIITSGTYGVSVTLDMYVYITRVWNMPPSIWKKVSNWTV